RDHSLRFVILVGDAPPHGVSSHELAVEGASLNERRARGRVDICPCGLTLHDATSSVEQIGAVLHAVCMGSDRNTERAFSAIAHGTGGSCVPSQNAATVVGAIQKAIENELGCLALDSRVLEVCSRGVPDVQ